MRSALDQLFQPRSIFGDQSAIAEQNDSVGLAAVLIIDVPIGRELLDRDEQVISLLGTPPDHRSDQRVKWIKQGRSRPLLKE